MLMRVKGLLTIISSNFKDDVFHDSYKNIYPSEIINILP